MTFAETVENNYFMGTSGLRFTAQQAILQNFNTKERLVCCSRNMKRFHIQRGSHRNRDSGLQYIGIGKLTIVTS